MFFTWLFHDMHTPHLSNVFSDLSFCKSIIPFLINPDRLFLQKLIENRRLNGKHCPCFFDQNLNGGIKVTQGVI